MVYGNSVGDRTGSHELTVHKHIAAKQDVQHRDVFMHLFIHEKLTKFMDCSSTAIFLTSYFTPSVSLIY